MPAQLWYPAATHSAITSCMGKQAFSDLQLLFNNVSIREKCVILIFYIVIGSHPPPYEEFGSLCVSSLYS